MIRIAVCDDSKQELQELEILMKQFVEQQEDPNISLSMYQSPLSLLNDVETYGAFDLYLLDVLMQDMNGIELGERLREYDPDGVIIYLTASKEYALNAFHVFAFQYLVKPISPEFLFDILKRALIRANEAYAKLLPIKTKEGIVRVPYHSIIYAELQNRSIRYHLTDQTVLRSLYVRGTFEEMILPLLEDERFVHTHKSFVANLHRVKRAEPQFLIMEGGFRVPISRRYATEVKKQYVKSLMKRMRPGS